MPTSGRSSGGLDPLIIACTSNLSWDCIPSKKQLRPNISVPARQTFSPLPVCRGHLEHLERTIYPCRNGSGPITRPKSVEGIERIRSAVTKQLPVYQSDRILREPQSACLPDGSRVRRESHARFCESLCQEGAKASCCTKDEGGPFGAAL
jgi:hypothetical protein